VQLFFIRKLLLISSLGLLLRGFRSRNWRILFQLLDSVVYPLVFRFRHRAKTLIAVECLLNILSNVIFYIGTKPMPWRLWLLPHFTCGLTAFGCTWRSVVATLFGTKTTAISKLPAFTSFLYNKTFPIFPLTLVIVKNHLFKLIQLKSLHKSLLLLLKVELFLWIRVLQPCVPFVSWVTVFIQSVSWFIFVARVVISINCVDNGLLIKIYLISSRRRWLD